MLAKYAHELSALVRPFTIFAFSYFHFKQYNAMQDRYAGDTGDFSKFYLLKKLVPGHLRLGLNWYRVELAESNNDGRHIRYLSEGHRDAALFERHDHDLYHQLRQAVNAGRRSVRRLEELAALPQSTIYYSELLHHHQRDKWFDGSCRIFEEADIICCDPDNGLEVKSCMASQRRSVKYMLYEEVKKYYAAGKSLVVYQHVSRMSSRAGQMEARIRELTTRLPIARSHIVVFYFGKGSGRFYFLLMQDAHIPALAASISHIRDTCGDLLSVEG